MIYYLSFLISILSVVFVTFKSLLPTPEQCIRDTTKESHHLASAISADSSLNRSQNSQSLNSTIDSPSSTPVKSDFSTPIKTNFATPTGSKFTSPAFSSRTSTPFNSIGYNTSGSSNLNSLNCSPGSMHLLEKRLVSKDTKQYSLEDFLVTKEKQGKQKKKKRASLMSCNSPKNVDKSNEEDGKVTSSENSAIKGEI